MPYIDTTKQNTSIEVQLRWFVNLEGTPTLTLIRQKARYRIYRYEHRSVAFRYVTSRHDPHIPASSYCYMYTRYELCMHAWKNAYV